MQYGRCVAASCAQQGNLLWGPIGWIVYTLRLSNLESCRSFGSVLLNFVGVCIYVVTPVFKHQHRHGFSTRMCLCIHACVFTPVSQYLCSNTGAYIRVLFVFSIIMELLLLVSDNHIRHRICSILMMVMIR